MHMLRALREEAAVCRRLAREITDAASIEMFLDRAAQLEARAAAMEDHREAGSARRGSADRGGWAEEQQPSPAVLAARAKRSRRGGPRIR